MLLWKAARGIDLPWLGKVFLAALFLGWGLFILIEGIMTAR